MQKQGKRWTEDDLEMLKAAIIRGYSAMEAASLCERSAHAVVAKAVEERWLRPAERNRYGFYDEHPAVAGFRRPLISWASNKLRAELIESEPEVTKQEERVPKCLILKPKHSSTDVTRPR